MDESSLAEMWEPNGLPTEHSGDKQKYRVVDEKLCLRWWLHGITERVYVVSLAQAGCRVRELPSLRLAIYMSQTLLGSDARPVET